MQKIIASLLLVFSSMASADERDLKPCGQQGSTEERIADCRRVNGDSANRQRYWNLVTKADLSSQEWWQDSVTELTWGPKLTFQMDRVASDAFSFRGASETCTKLQASLPTVEDFMLAEQHYAYLGVMFDWERSRYWAKSYSDKYPIAWWYGTWNPDKVEMPILLSNLTTVPGKIRCISR
ncbi:MAG: hypothetical protein NTV34_10640 [Proteobacteria bacterium]|nr:hypothetical protein [Pseudomonadota bacterium]